MLMLLLSTVVGVFLFYNFLVKPYNYWMERGVKQESLICIVKGIWGSILRRRSFPEMVQWTYNQCQGVRYSGAYQFFIPTLILRDPDLIKQIAVRDFDHFTDRRSFIPEDVDPLWSKNLSALKGQKWRDMRAILSPSFTSSKMKTMFVLISECAENFVQHFLKKDEDVVTIEFKDTFTRFTNDVIATTAFGIQVDSLGQPNNRFYLMGKETTEFRGFWKTMKIFGLLLMPNVLKFLNIKLFSKEVGTFFNQIVSETIKLREENNIVRPDMINLLLEARKGIQKQDETDLVQDNKPPTDISDMDITAQALIFFFGGFDSVSGLMCFLAYELAANPDIQNRLREEVRSTLEECGGKLTYEGLVKMKYMEMVVSETLRKWPIALSVDRVCTKPYTIEPTKPGEKPLHLVKDDVIWLPIFGIHRDPEHFPNPEGFDPERFNENKGNIKPYTYFPFGLGPRNCIGSRFALLETKVVIFHLLKNFELIPVEKSIIPLKISKKQFNLTAEGGFWFGLKRINA